MLDLRDTKQLKRKKLKFFNNNYFIFLQKIIKLNKKLFK